MKTESVDQFFDSIKPTVVKRYNKHWEAIRPVTVDDFFRRYLFAFTSVHSTWQSNCRGYLALKDLSWVDNKALLLSRLVWARCGVHNMRTKTIWAFKEQFYANPDRFCNVDGDWRTYRNELVKEINGLGVTKVSFALEMCFPKEALVSCIDVHGLRLYGLDVKHFTSKSGLDAYEKAEDHWIDASVDVGCSPTISRAIYWDRKQKQKDSGYWTHVL